MIVCISIVDKHRKPDDGHIGTYSFEIDYPGDSHFDFMTIACPVDGEHLERPHLGRLRSRKELEAE